MFLKKEPLVNKASLVKSMLLLLVITPLQYAFSHGTVTSPASRVWNCFTEDPESPDSPACRDAVLNYGTQGFYDWNEVARMDADGMHRQLIADGNLASAGRPDKYGGLDQVRNDWVATPVKPGPLTITWTITAPHETLYYDVYITKADWTPDQPLTWDSLELLVRTGSRPSADFDDIDIVLPARTGKHVLYSVWQRSLSIEAFYSTSDIDFGTEAQFNTAPTAAFRSVDDSCENSIVNFNAEISKDIDGDALTYAWDFGDGTTAEGIKVSHNFANNTTNNVKLTVSDGKLTGSTIEEVKILPCAPETIDAVTINSDVLSGNAPLSINFNSDVTIFQDNNTLINYNWSFGDDTTSNLQGLNKVFNTPGIYNVTLTAMGPKNSKTATVTVIVNNKLAVDVGLSLEYRTTCDNNTGKTTHDDTKNDTHMHCNNTVNNVIAPNLIINNSSSNDINYKDLAIRYWFTSEDNKDLNFVCDFSQFGSENVYGKFGEAQGVDYLEITFDDKAGILQKNNNSGQINTRINKINWTNFNQADDYSFDSYKSEFEQHDKITLYQNGELIFGIEPILLSVNKIDTKANAFILYPNPAKNTINIRANKGLQGKSIAIFDLMGKKMTSKIISLHNTETSVNISNLKSGLYIVQIKDSSGNVKNKKLTIK